METYIGIDTGVTGAIAVQHTQFDRSDPRRWEIFDMPTSEIPMKDKGHKTEYRIKEFFELLARFPGALACVEETHAVKGSPNAKFTASAVTNFSMGESRMIVTCALTMNNIPIYRAAPQSWKAKMLVGLSDKGDKEAIRLKTIELYPQLEEFLRLKKHHNRAEAVLINDYGRRFFYETSAHD